MKTVIYGNAEEYSNKDLCSDCLMKKYSSLGCRVGITRVIRSITPGKKGEKEDPTATVVGGVVECDFRCIQGSIVF